MQEEARTEDRPLTKQELATVVEDRARRDFQMSVEEFQSAIESGRIAENLSATDLAILIGASPRS